MIRASIFKWLNLLFWNLFQNEPGRWRAPRTFFPRKFSRNILEKRGNAWIFRKYLGKNNSRKWYKHCLLRPVKCPRPYTGTLFLHRRIYKNRVRGGINVPVSKWEFALFWGVIFQWKASFSSLLLQCTLVSVENGISISFSMEQMEREQVNMHTRLKIFLRDFRLWVIC